MRKLTNNDPVNPYETPPTTAGDQAETRDRSSGRRPRSEHQLAIKIGLTLLLASAILISIFLAMIGMVYMSPLTGFFES